VDLYDSAAVHGRGGRDNGLRRPELQRVGGIAGRVVRGGSGAEVDDIPGLGVEWRRRLRAALVGVEEGVPLPIFVLKGRPWSQPWAGPQGLTQGGMFKSEKEVRLAPIRSKQQKVLRSYSQAGHDRRHLKREQKYPHAYRMEAGH
jgi:hypothetical protein